jgi:hypothetical protein
MQTQMSTKIAYEKYFGLVKMSGGKKYRECLACKKDIAINQEESHHNLNSHLQHKHKKLWDSFQEADLSSASQMLSKIRIFYRYYFLLIRLYTIDITFTYNFITKLISKYLT